MKAYRFLFSESSWVAGRGKRYCPYEFVQVNTWSRLL